MARLEVRLLGTPEIIQAGKPVTGVRSDKVRGLLAFLAVEADKPHRREKLAGLLWPDYPEASARANLRRALADLRQAIGDTAASPPYLHVTPQTVQFDIQSDAWVDVRDFQAFTKNENQRNGQSIPGWGQAVELYQGEFMEGFSLPDSPAFEEWILLNRERLNRLILEYLHGLVDSLEGSGDYGRGLKYAWRQLELDPLRESAHRQVMRLLALSGQREAAIAQYDACAKVLARELGVEPSAETWELYQALVKGELPVGSITDKTLTDQKPKKVGESPYRGLAAFREQDAAFFFGREGFTQRLVEKFRVRGAVTVILGPSGAGKSSAVHAGVLPRLRAEKDWLIASLRPGMSPFHSLATAMLSLLEPELSETEQLLESQRLAAALSEGSLPLYRLVERLLDKDLEKSRVLLFIDQFEELYTLCQDAEIRRRFLDELFETSEKYRERRNRTVVLLLTLRADFLGHTLAYRPFADILQEGSLMMGPMTREELRTAIEKPATVQGALFEGGLVERILDDVGAEPGNLPLLEFALTLLWEHVSSGWLTHSGYENIGQVKGALARYADQIYEELNEAEQEHARRIFLQLIRPGEGTEDTRRLASRAEIGETNWPLVQHLADQRLVVTDQDASAQETVEVVHEALIASWGRLREWIEADRTFRTWQERVRSAQRQWDASGKDEGALLRGAPLAEAEGWQTDRASDLTAAEREYIEASRDLRRRQQLERERVRRRVVIGLSAGLAITLILALLAGWQWRSAQQARSIAEMQRDQAKKSLSQSLASQSQLLKGSELDLASLLSIEAVNINPSDETRGSLLAALTERPHLTRILYGHEDEVLAIAFSPDDHFLATGDKAGGIFLWEISGQGSASVSAKSKPLVGHTEQITSLAFSPDGRSLASASFDDTIRLWDVATGKQIDGPLTGHSDNVWSVVFSPDGKRLFSAGSDRQVLIWEIDSNTTRGGPIRRQPLASGIGQIYSLAISPDGRILASGMYDGTVMLWDPNSFVPLTEPLVGHKHNVRTLEFSPDGYVLASGGQDKQIILWDMRRNSPTFGQPLGDPLSGHNDWVTDLAFNAVNRSMVSTGSDGLCLEWNLSSLFGTARLSAPKILVEQQESLWGLDITLDGRWLITNGGRGSIYLMDLAKIHPLAQELGVHPTGGGITMAFSPNGRILASADWDGGLIFWEKATGKRLLLPIQTDSVSTNDIDFSPDGSILATVGGDNQIRLWDANPASEKFGKEWASFPGEHSNYLTAVAFHPKREILITASEGSDDVILWDIDPNSVTFGKMITNFPTEHRVLPIWAFHFDRTGERLVSIKPVEVTIWDMSTHPPQAIRSIELPVTFLRLSGRVMSFDPATFVLAFAAENIVNFFNLDPNSPSFGEVLSEPLEIRGARINALAFSPEEGFLASGDRNGSLQLWDAITKQPLGPFLPGTDPVNNLTFSPDGSTLAVGGTRGSVILWDMQLDSWKERACQRANRNLTEEEWRRFFGDEPYRETCPGLPSTGS